MQESMMLIIQNLADSKEKLAFRVSNVEFV